MKTLCTMIMIMFFLTHPGKGADYYVDLSGSDITGDGSAGKPWRTLRHAAMNVPANQGHVIRLSTGTFVENGNINIPTGVSIEGAGKDVTILKADPSFYYYPASPGYATDRFLIALQNASYVNGNQHLKGFSIDGDGKKLHGGIYVHYRSSVTIDDIKVTGTNFTAIWLWDVKDSRVTNTDLVNCSWGSTGYQVGALNLGNLERVEIDHCTIDENTGYGIKAIGPSGYNDLLYMTIHDCRVSVNPTGLWNNGSAPNIAIELWQVSPLHCEIYNCYIDNTVSLVNANNNPSTGNQTIRVHHNTIDLESRAHGAGYAIELTMHDAEIDHNYIFKGSYGIANWDNPMKNWSIHHNTFYGIEGVYPGEIVRSQWSGLHNVDFYNNTIEFAGTKTASVIGIYGGASDHVNLKNNLIINSNTAYSYYPNQLIHTENSATMSALTVANNLLRNLPLGAVPGTYTGNLSADPLIMKSGSRPAPFYQPLPTSPLIDAGLNLGLPFIGQAPDIGAYEADGTATNNPPAVTITSPANLALFTSGNSVTINAAATDNDGTVSKVEFFNGVTRLGEDLTEPYSFAWSNVPLGTYVITAKATDNAGAVSVSPLVSITMLSTNQSPAVSITSPSNNAAFTTGNSVAINANASDPDGTVAKVEFFNGAMKLGEDLTSPYSFVWNNLAAGSYSLTAQATDDKGSVAASATVSISVAAANRPPSVTITSPANNASFSAGNTIAINANAADTDGTIAKVEFYKGTIKLGEDVTSPYGLDWTNVAAGTYTLKATATDNKGARTTSKGVLVTVTPGNTPPAVAITSPLNNIVVQPGSAITIAAQASDADGNVAKVQFFAGTTLLSEDIAAPYTFIWANPPSGVASLTARATDDRGAETTSSAVTVTVGDGYVKMGLFAADATLNGAMKLVSDSTALKGSYFAMASGYGTNYYIPPSSNGQFIFSLPKTDTYVVWVRIKSPAFNNQGFHVYDGKGHWTSWVTGVHTEWTWVEVTNAYTNQIATFPFTAGINYLRMGWFMENTKLDAVIITNDRAFIPTERVDAAARTESTSLSPVAGEATDTDLGAYPNPATDKLTIHYFSPALQEAAVVLRGATSPNITERTVALREGWNDIELDVSGEEGGLYLLSVTPLRGERFTQKIIIRE